MLVLGIIIIIMGLALIPIGIYMPADRSSDKTRAFIGVPILIIVGILFLTGVIKF